MSDKTPDYMPAMWRRGRFNTWFAGSPRRVFIWFLAMPPLAVLFTIYSWLGHSSALKFALTVSTAVICWQAIVYGPRAWRAWRRGGTRELGSRKPSSS